MSTLFSYLDSLFVLHSKAEKQCKIPESRFLFMRLLAVTDHHSL